MYQCLEFLRDTSRAPHGGDPHIPKQTLLKILSFGIYNECGQLFKELFGDYKVMADKFSLMS